MIYKNWTLNTFFLLIISSNILFIACLSDQSNEYANFEKHAIPKTKYTINPHKDTTLFGPQGTRIFIGAETFQIPINTLHKDSIGIVLKEFYRHSDILLANLETASDGEILETAGMLHIKALAGNELLEMKPNKRIVVHFPKKSQKKRTMNLFYADEKTSTDTSVNNWKIDTVNLIKKTLNLSSFGWWYPEYGDSTGYDFKPKNFVDTGYYWNPLNFYVQSYEFSESTKKEIETTLNKNDFPNFDSWNDYGLECQMEISTEGFIKNPQINTNVSKKAKQEILQFLFKLPQLEPGKNKYGEIIERKGLLFIQGGNIIPLYKTNKEYLESFNRKYASFEHVPIQNMDDAEMNFYIFSVNKLGWINCDRFIDSKETIDLIVETPIDPQVKIKMIFNDINGVLKAKVSDNYYRFNNVPKNKGVTLFATKKNTNGQLMVALKKIVISEDPIKDLKFSPITLGELKTKLDEI